MKNLLNTRLSNYDIDSMLGEGGMSYVFHALNQESGQAVAIKVLKEGAGSSRLEDVIRFRREATVISKLSHENLVNVLEVGDHDGLNYLVMELVEGVELAGYRPSSIDESVMIARQLAAVLDYVHHAGIIHRDLKPGNVMVVRTPDGAGPVVKLFDFGLSQVMELASLRETREIVGTFSYMSPEQSGIIRKPVDERSDLYSLGIILYELLTGELPFKGTEIGAIMHQQIARQPQPLREINKQIPRVLEEIVLKLLRKDPEDRYQTAKALVVDLEKYGEGAREFTIARGDRKHKLSYRTRLIGRQDEFARLKELYRRASDGAGSVCLVGGEAGRGKSRLIEELRSYVYSEGGDFIDGKCFDQANKIPYQPFSDALNKYVHTLERLDEREKIQRVQRLKESVGGLGEIICRMNPLMREMMGDMPKLVELDPERENRRFLMVCSRFFRSLGSPGKPCVIMLDDLQWCDESSLNVLQEILVDIGSSPLLILGTYRDNETGNDHRLSRVMQDAADKKLPLIRIALENFDVGRIASMLNELLGIDSGDQGDGSPQKTIETVSAYLYRKGRGNPFFTLEIARQLIEDKIIAYDEKIGNWIVDAGRLETARISDTIVDTVLRRIHELPDELIELLSAASVIGRKFQIHLLCALSASEQDRIIGLVDEAVSLQLLERGSDRGDILFVHDRVRDAFYARLSVESKRQLHAAIAQGIERLYPQQKEEYLFDLAHHYIESGNDDKIFEYALPAAEKARQGYANEDAIRYYMRTMDVLAKKGMAQDRIAHDIQKNIGEIYLRMGRGADAITLYNDVLKHPLDNLEKGVIYCNIGLAYFKSGNWSLCEQNLLDSLRLLGHPFSTKRSMVLLTIAGQLVKIVTGMVLPAWSRRPQSELDKQLTRTYNGLAWLYVLSDSLSLMCVIFKMYTHNTSHSGESEELALAHMWIGTLLGANALFALGFKFHRKALAIRERVHSEWGIAQSYQSMSYFYSWSGNQTGSREYLEKSIEIYRNIGDMWELGMSEQCLGITCRYQAYHDQAIALLNKYLSLSRDNNNTYGITSALDSILLCYCELGDFENALRSGQEALDKSHGMGIAFTECVSLTGLGYVMLEQGRYKEAIDYLAEARKIKESNILLEDYTVSLYPYLIDAHIGLYNSMAGTMDAKEQAVKLRRIRFLCYVAFARTFLWNNHYCTVLRGYAKYLALRKNYRKADSYFRKSIALSEQIHRRYETAKGQYEYGNFLKECSQMPQARRQWELAYDLFKSIGAKAYEQKVSACLGLQKNTAHLASTSQERLSDRLELASVILVSQALSSILDLGPLLDKIMDVSIEVTGAERGYLLLYPFKDGMSAPTDPDLLEVKTMRNIDKEALKAEDFAFSRTTIRRAVESRTAQLVVDAGNEDVLKTQASVIRYGLKSIMCVPLIVHDILLGIIYVDNRNVSGLFTADKLEILKTLSVQAGISIENARLYRAVQDKARIDEELRLGHEIQMNLLPEKVPAVSGLRLAGVMDPAREIGGDYYDFIVPPAEAKTGKAGIVIGDVSGKGVGSGLIMAAAKATLLSLSLQESGPKEILWQANRVITGYTQGKKMMTMLYLQWDTQARTMTYASCGHEHILVARKNPEGGCCTVETIQSGGFMMGVMPDIGSLLTERTLSLSADDTILLYTDGAIDARNADNTPYTLERLQKSFAHFGTLPVEELISRLKEDIHRHIGTAEQYDDITLVGIKILPACA